MSVSGVFSGVHLLDVKLVSGVFSGVHLLDALCSVSGVFHGVHLLDAFMFSVWSVQWDSLAVWRMGPEGRKSLLLLHGA